MVHPTEGPGHSDPAIPATAGSSDRGRPDRVTEYLFQIALAERWGDLAPELRALHSVTDVGYFSGRAEITRGTSLLARLAGWFFGFPPAGSDVRLHLTVTRQGRNEIWQRNFDGHVMRSILSPAAEPYRYRERIRLFTCELDLAVHEGAMSLPVRRGWFLGIPSPRSLLPISDSREYAANGRFHFDISVSAPLGWGLLVHYHGWLESERG